MTPAVLVRLMLVLLQSLLLLVVVQAAPLLPSGQERLLALIALVTLIAAVGTAPVRLLQSPALLTALVLIDTAIAALSAHRHAALELTGLAYLVPVLVAGVGLRAGPAVGCAVVVAAAFGLFEWRHAGLEAQWPVIPVLIATALVFVGKTRVNETELKRLAEASEKERHESMCDTLTGLPNRAQFIERVWRSVKWAKQNEEFLFAVLFVDLDGFKPINDKLGHKAGDAVLIETAKRLQSCLRRGDIVARYGGDEFTLLVNHITSRADVVRIAERILAKVKEPILVGQRVHVGASIGIAVSTNLHERPEDLIRDADLAMYRAKAKGKGQYEVSCQLRDAAGIPRGSRRDEPENALRQG
ncbi:diguanylate cyclase domain-containing protein [Candidatus Nitrospira bockiana]